MDLMLGPEEGLLIEEEETAAVILSHVTDTEIRAGRYRRDDQIQPLYFTDKETEARRG